MGLKKGQVNNPGGRPKGSPNRATKDLRVFVRNFLEKNMATLQEDFNKLDAKDKLLFMERLLKYVIPVQSQAKVDFGSLTNEQLTQVANEILTSIE
jgi:hypothetical protein